METDTGRVLEATVVAYDDEVLNAGWAEVPQIEARLQERTVVRETPAGDVDGYLARLYAAQGMVGR